MVIQGLSVFVINSASAFSESVKLASLLLHPLDQNEAESIINDGQFCKQLCECIFTSAKHTSLLLLALKAGCMAMQGLSIL
jgi:hypothetical protein